MFSFLAANVVGLSMLVMNFMFLFGLWRELKKNDLNWNYLISRDGKRVSTTKILQLVGGFTGTWIMVHLTLGGSITWHMFMIYLAYVASVEGFSKFVEAKFREPKERR
jgi:hypothetical protein